MVEAGDKGLGVVADQRLASGTLLFPFTGPIVPFEAIDDFTHHIQFCDDRFIGPSGGIDDLVNHGCEPNAGLRTSASGGLELFALQVIEVGTEISFDYSTCLDLEEPWPTCLCEASGCRGEVVAFRNLPAPLRRKYLDLGAVPEFQRRHGDGEGRGRANAIVGGAV